MITSERVAYGIALLDLRSPGWRAQIDWERLNMQLADRCVLGQLYGDYDYGLSVLGISRDDSVCYGFICEDDIMPYGQGEDGEYYCAPCRALAKCWEALK